MKKNILKNVTLSLIFTFAVSSVFAVDFGATIDNSSKLYTNDFSSCSLDQTDSVLTWTKINFLNSGTTYLALEGLFSYEYTNSALGSEDADKLNDFILDLTLFKFFHTLKLNSRNTLSFSAGRFFISDSTSTILLQNADGLLTKYETPHAKLSLYCGYTGLLNAKSITMLNSSDVTFSYDSSLVYDWNTSYLVASLSGGLPFILFNQSISLEVLSLTGLHGPYTLNTENTTTIGDNRFYATLFVNGPLSTEIFYTFSSTFSTYNFTEVANLSKAKVDFYFPFMNGAASINAVYASGENGFLTSFKGITSNTASYSYDEPEYSGLLKAGASASIKPVSNILVTLGSDAVFLCPESTFSYGGFEVYANASYQIFTDLNLSLNAYYYKSSDSTTDNAGATLKVAVAL